MLYVKVINNAVVDGPIRLPSFYRYADGRHCAQWNLLVQEKPEEAINEGFYPLEDNIPAHDTAYQVVEFSSYEILPDKVIRHFTAQDYPLAPLKETRCDLVNVLRDQKIAGGFVLNGVEYDSDQKSLLNINGTVTNIAIGHTLPEGFAWRAADNTDIPMTADDVKALGGAALAHVYTMHTVARFHKDAINALTTAQEVVDYDITTGW